MLLFAPYMLSPFTVEMSAKMGFNHSFLNWGFSLKSNTQYDLPFKEMSADPSARLMKKIYLLHYISTYTYLYI